MKWWNSLGAPKEPDWPNYRRLKDVEYQNAKDAIDGLIFTVKSYRPVGYLVIPVGMTFAGAKLVKECRVRLDKKTTKMISPWGDSMPTKRIFIIFQWWKFDQVVGKIDKKPGDLAMTYWPHLKVIKL